MRIFVFSRGYPSPERLYNYPFVHRRVLEYEARGHIVCVFMLKKDAPLSVRTYDGVTVHEGGSDAFVAQVDEFGPDCIAAHSIADDFWPGLSRVPTNVPIYGWIHGAEILSYYRTAQRREDADDWARAKRTFDRRMAFWKSLLPAWPSNLHLVFVSQCSKRAAFDNLGQPLPSRACSVIHNSIDTQLFPYHPKTEEHRFEVLSIRPFGDWRYANDLSVEAIRILSTHELFSRFSFRFVGDGRLFDETVAPLRQYDNVTVERRFLAQSDIAPMHRQHGVFLVPTRDDAQGVSRDEAMSSGLVPVTNNVGAIPEFADSSCAGLAERDDAAGIAERLLEMAMDPALFLSRSRAASERVRSRLTPAHIIPQELELLGRGIGSA